MKPVCKLALFFAVASFSLSPAFAQDTTTTAPSGAAAPAAKPMMKERSAKSIECSKEADAKGLHGEARKQFRSECKKGGGGGDAGTSGKAAPTDQD